MSARTRTGTCHLCGKHGKLSFEHVPPRKAFNDFRTESYGDLRSLLSDTPPWDQNGKKTNVMQKGFGDYTLCAKCNNDTGSWYAPHFIEFTWQAASQYLRSSVPRGNIIRISLRDIYPLHIIKQVLTMFASVDAPSLMEGNRHLRSLILEKTKHGIDPKRYGVFVYLLRGTIRRYIGSASCLNISTKEQRVFSELVAPPFGYILELDPESDRKYFNLNCFANQYAFDESTDITLPIPVLESNSPLPGDHRSTQEVLQCYHN